MNIAIRADSGAIIGSGHVMRCLALATKLQADGHNILFICKAHAGHIKGVIVEKGFECVLLKIDSGELQDNYLAHSSWLGGSQKQDAEESLIVMQAFFGEIPECVVVDHYGIDKKWEELFFLCGSKVFVIDDLADRHHNCHLLLDQTLGREESAYRDLVPPFCQLLLGTNFAMLRDEFVIDKDIILAHREKGIQAGLGRVLVMMGGTDPEDITSDVLKCLLQDAEITKTTVVLGPTAVHRERVAVFCRDHRLFELQVGADNIAELMLEHDIAIGAAGSSAWERCAMGLPSLMMVLADNQKNIAEALMQRKAGQVFSSSSRLELQVSSFRNGERYVTMIHSCFAICDGLGVSRVVLKLEAL